MNARRHRPPRLAPLACLMVVLASAAPLAAETLLVVRKTGDAIDFVDPGSGLALASVPLGHAPHEVAVSPDGRRAVVSNYGSRERPGTTVSVIDLAGAREERRIELAPHGRPHGVHWYAPDRVAVTAEGSRHLLVVDPLDGRVVDAIETGQDVSHMVAVAPGGERAYVTNIGSGTTSALDLAAGRKLRDVATGGGSEALALTPDGRELWVAARADGHVAVVDTGTLEIVARLPLDGVPIRIAMSHDGRTAWVTCAATAELVAFDVAARKETARRRVDVPLAPDADARPFAKLAPGSPLPVGLLAAPDGRSLYVAATQADVVVRYDAATLAPLGSIPVDGEPDGLGVTPLMPRAPCHACTPAP